MTPIHKQLLLLQEKFLDSMALWQVLWDVSRGLAFLHESGILHLDIKPENIYRDLAGTWRIGDFGLAVANESRVGSCVLRSVWNQPKKFDSYE